MLTVGVWARAGTTIETPYPCQCWVAPWLCGRQRGETCPCWGRPDLAQVPPECCGRRYRGPWIAWRSLSG